MGIKNSDFLISDPNIYVPISLMSDIFVHFPLLLCSLYIDNVTIRSLFPSMQLYRWWNGWCARLECGTSWIRPQIGSKHRL